MNSTFDPNALYDRLRALVTNVLSEQFCVAYSGGADSTALLHAMSELAGQTAGVRAVHINHGLNPNSDHWAAHCEKTARQLGLSLLCQLIAVDRNSGRGLEAEARHARYQEFERQLQPGEILLCAHHADDQMETMLLHLIRGSGVAGLSGMPARRELGKGILLRPMLSFSRDDLIAYLRRIDAEWIKDESNEQLSHDRNYIRHELVPRIRDRWPAARESIVRAAAHCREADEMLRELAFADGFGPHENGKGDAEYGSCLDSSMVLDLSTSRQRNLLRAWIRARGYTLPNARKLEAILDDVLSASSDRLPVVAWSGAELRRYRNMLYLSDPLAEIEADLELDWDPKLSLQLPAGLGSLALEPVVGAGLAREHVRDSLRVAFRHGGESLLPGPGPHHRSLKKLFQENGILPWMRNRIPLVFYKNTLIAVADLWTDQNYVAQDGEAGMQIAWQNAPAVQQK